MIPANDAKAMISLARQAIISSFSGEGMDVPASLHKYSKAQGVFVTLKKDGELRGCIGFPEPVYPLIDAIAKAASAAAFEDPRFPPVKEEEMGDIRMELSVLTVPEEIKAPKEKLVESIKVGRDGLIIRKPPYSGLLLPQVPVEWKWDEEEFLKHTCEKAGLPSDAWKEEDCKVFAFQAQVCEE